MESSEKVFGIGFHKTGTTSLGSALMELGYRVTGPNFIHESNLRDTIVELSSKLSHEFDAFQDNPWPMVFKEMDELWPNAKFILTVRDEKNWINSQIKHFGKTVTSMREYIYGDGRGCPEGNEEHYISTMKKHNEEVMEYFKNNPGKLLVLDFEKGDGWEKICAFLDKPIPNKPFPRLNSAEDRLNNDGPVHRSKLKLWNSNSV